MALQQRVEGESSQEYPTSPRVPSCHFKLPVHTGSGVARVSRFFSTCCNLALSLRCNAVATVYLFCGRGGLYTTLFFTYHATPLLCIIVRWRVPQCQSCSANSESSHSYCPIHEMHTLPEDYHAGYHESIGVVDQPNGVIHSPLHYRVV